jgi:hypothetical protein
MKREAPLLAFLLFLALPAAAFDPQPLRLAIQDLAATYPGQYTKAPEFLARLDRVTTEADFAALQREALLANPLLDFDRLLVLERKLGKRARVAMSAELGVGTLNAHSNDSLRRTGWDNRISILSNLRGEPRIERLYQPDGGRILTDIDLHPDADRIMFSSIGGQGNWRLFEMGTDGSFPRQITPDDGADVGHFDSCYLPDGRIIFASTAVYQGLPCEAGGRIMVCLYLLDPATGNIRQLTFEQDSDWCPTVLPDGRVMYQRWEYSDLAHSNSRRLFQMNPDGTNQNELYGSNSYFPNSFFYARPMPGHPRKIIGVAGGHHGIARSGRLLILDPSLGRKEAEGVVQEIPGHGKKVEAIVRDRLVDGVWPQFLMPYPLSEKYVLVSCKPAPDALWGIYLVDVFDNMTLIREMEDTALLEPIALMKTQAAPCIPDRIDTTRSDATVLLTDIYRGEGLAGIPPGTVKSLRVVEYYFSKRGTGGLIGSIGMDGPWDIKRVLGTVPVEADGSAHFKIPAQTPVTVQPLDDQGQALQLMRSWFVGMPGESVSCVGCHEGQNKAPSPAPPLAALRPPSDIRPSWHGPTRGFNFAREVQPVLDRHCVQCHADGPGQSAPYLKGDRMITDWSTQMAGNAGKNGGKFSASYAELHRHIRRPGIESDIRLLSPMDYHFSSTGLGQMLRNGHHGVRLDDESWQRLATWADLNAPYHGTWGEIVGAEKVAPVMARSNELRKLYAPSGPTSDFEKIPPLPAYDTTPVIARPAPKEEQQVVIEVDAAAPESRTLDLGDGMKMELARVPGGRLNGKEVRPFWIGRFEVSNEQFRKFKPAHDSRMESRHGYQFGRLGYDMNEARQPVVRVSWDEASGFCRWLAERTQGKAGLPTGIQWEWACRAGATTAFPFGAADADYSGFANLGDRRLKEFAACTAREHYTKAEPITNPSRYDDWIPRDDRFDDGGFVTVESGRYQANAWGLHDMIGNAWEWTNESTAEGDRIARGGSWYDRPEKATIGEMVSFRPYQRVFNVGFRIVFEESPKTAAK